jgi:hypothetical protein
VAAILMPQPLEGTPQLQGVPFFFSNPFDKWLSYVLDTKSEGQTNHLPKMMLWGYSFDLL